VNGGMGACDAWVAVGTPSVTLKVGSWEAEDMWNPGQDVYVITTGASDWFKINKVRGRSPDGMGVIFTSGSVVFDVKAGFDNEGPAGTENQLGIRPVVKFTAGAITLKVGGEFVTQKPKDTDSDAKNDWMGGGANVTMTAGTLTFGAVAAYGQNKVTTVDAITGVKTDADENVMSGDGYVNLAMGSSTLGLGVGYTTQDEADTKEMYGFVSYAMPLPVEGAFVKFAGSFASGTNAADEDLKAFGARVRFNYTF